MRTLIYILLVFTALDLKSQDSVFHIQAFKIVGNVKTKETVILRELGKNIGDTVQNLIPTAIVWQKRISGLVLFNYTHVELKRDTVFIEVVERIYIWGLPKLSWADRNFSVWWQTKDLRRLVYGGTLFFNNIKGENQDLVVTLLNGYNRLAELTYLYPFAFHNHGYAFTGKAGYWTNHELWSKTINNKLQFTKTLDRIAQQNAYLSFILKKRLNYFNRMEYNTSTSWISINPNAMLQNNSYLAFGNKQYQTDLQFEFIRDTRNQRDYPTQGMLLRAGIKNTLIGWGKLTQFNFTPFIRASRFFALNKNNSLATGIYSRYTFASNLPYMLSRQLGYQTDYVRGYEPYVADGRGFVLGKLAFRHALVNNKLLNFGNNKPLKNYKKVPFSLWFNIFADAGKVITPTTEASNSLNRIWQYGTGTGLDVIAWYSAMVRIEYSFNAMGNGTFNIAFLNAF